MTTVREQASAGRTAWGRLAVSTTEERNAAIGRIADELVAARDLVFAANARDMKRAHDSGAAAAVLDRLLVDDTRLDFMIEGLRQVRELPDPLNRLLEAYDHPAGFTIEKRSVPLGVIGIIFEGRPNVTVDAASLCLKSGNAVLLRGSSNAHESNRALVAVIRSALTKAGIPEDCVQLVADTARERVDEMLSLRGLLDVVIPRGGADLIEYVASNARVPVLETGAGNCHLYVDKGADLDKASAVALNAKCQRPSVCNAIETLLVHRDVAVPYLRAVVPLLKARGVACRGCEASRAIVPGIEPASEQDWGTEFLELILAVRVVGSLDEAVSHITKYGTRHSESIVTEDAAAANEFLSRVDAAAVYHNVSTRFTDGFEFGFGSEIGISTQKLHARGPMGLRELTAYKYIGRGSGQTRG